MVLLLTLCSQVLLYVATCLETGSDTCNVIDSNTLESDLYIPNIDLSRYETNFNELSQEMIAGLKASGFVSVSNISNLDYIGLYESSRWFFNLPPWIKAKVMRNKWNNDNKNCYRGYCPLIPGDPSYKEFFDIARNNTTISSAVCDKCDNYLYESTPYLALDTHENAINFHKRINENYEIFLNIAKQLMRLIANGLINDENFDHENNSILNITSIEYFEPMFLPHTLSTLRLIHSPPHYKYSQIIIKQGEDEPEGEEEGEEEWKGFNRSDNNIENVISNAPEHVDGGFLTLLITYDEGLQIKNENNIWYNIPQTVDFDCNNNKFGIVVNIGQVLSEMTNLYLKATYHRVLNLNKSRISIPFFFEPHFNATIIDIDNVLPSSSKNNSGNNNEYNFVQYGPWVNQRNKRYIEFTDEPVGMCFYYNNQTDCQTTTQEWIQTGLINDMTQKED